MTEDPSSDRRSLLPRFSLATLLLSMVVFGALGACLYYGMRAVSAGFSVEGIIVIVAVTAPPVLLFALKIGYVVLKWIDPPRGDE